MTIEIADQEQNYARGEHEGWDEGFEQARIDHELVLKLWVTPAAKACVIDIIATRGRPRYLPCEPVYRSYDDGFCKGFTRGYRDGMGRGFGFDPSSGKAELDDDIPL